MSDDISDSRKGLYYLGMVLGAAGFLCCFGAVASGGCGIAAGGMPHPGGIFPIFFVGMFLFIAGGIRVGIGRRGLAGSGIVLDPKQARKDLKPWAKMGGGILKDALEEAGLKKEESASSDLETDLRALYRLHQDGILSDEEYEAAKKKRLEK